MKRQDVFSTKVKPKREVPFEFVLEALEPLGPTTRAMFGCTAVYLGEQVVFILRKKGDPDDGVWVGFEKEREAEVLRALPRLEPITILPNARGWKKLSAANPDFEDDLLAACAQLRRGEAPIGKVPVRKKAKPQADTRPRAQPKAKKPAKASVRSKRS